MARAAPSLALLSCMYICICLFVLPAIDVTGTGLVARGHLVRRCVKAKS
jgi:hypothetical protein